MKPFHLFIRSLSALLALCLAAGLAACSSDELPASAGSPLPEGTYPVELTATVAAAQTRAAGKDAWVGGEQIGVRVGSGDAARTGAYLIKDASGAMEPNGAAGLYWTNTAVAPIAAWYPQEAVDAAGTVQPSGVVDISDQSAGYAWCDYLRAETTGQFPQPVALSFTHQMAKVKCELVRGDGVTEAEIQNATVQVYGATQVSRSDGEVSAETYGWISTHATDREALVVPQCMDGKPFIRVKMGEGNYVYTPPAGAADLAAGTAYTYTITVKKDGIEVTAEAASKWKDQIIDTGTLETNVFRVYLPERHGQTLTYSNNVTVKDDYLEVTGNSFSLSFPITDENYTNGFLVEKGQAEMVRTGSAIDNSLVCTYTLRSDIHLKYKICIQVGDYYYADGISLPYVDPNRTCIGVVFKVGAGSGDSPDNYPSDKLVDNRIHGYAVALEDAHLDVGGWGIPGTDETSLTNEEYFTDKYNGYTNTLAIQQSEGSKDKYNSTDVNQPSADNQYWAFKVASEYKKTTPDKSSGWYLPSIGQLQDIYNLPGRAERFIAAGGKDFITADNFGRYWSATEKDSHSAWHWRFDGNGADNYTKNKLRDSYVRSVLTF